MTLYTLCRKQQLRREPLHDYRPPAAILRYIPICANGQQRRLNEQKPLHAGYEQVVQWLWRQHVNSK
jgi:hypothetical protein